MIAMYIVTRGEPFRRRAYKIPLLKQQFVNYLINEMLDDRVIRQSYSPYESPGILDP